MEEINNPPPPLPFYGHPAQKFPLWVKYGSFLERPKNMGLISCSSKYMTIIIQIANGQTGSFMEC